MANLNIREYDSNAQIQASDRGPESLNIAGRRIGALYSEAGSAITSGGRAIGSGIAEAGENVAKYLGAQDVSHGAVGFAGLLAAANKDWNDTAKGTDPNDPTIAQKFMQEHLEPALEKFRSGFTTEIGRKWADERINAMRQHFTEKTIGDQAERAGIAAHVNAEKTVNTLTNTVAQDSSPKTLDMALDTLKSSVIGISQSPNLSAVQQEKVQAELIQKGSEKIVKSSITAALYDNPDRAEAMAKDPKYQQFVDGAEINTLAKQVRSQKRVDATLERQRQHDELQKATAHTMSQAFDNIYNPDLPPDQRLTNDKIRQIPETQLTEQGRLKLYETLEHKAGEGFIENPKGNMLDVLAQIRQGRITEQSDLDQMMNKKLNYDGWKATTAELRDKGDPQLKEISAMRAEFMKDRESQVNPKDLATLATLPQNVDRMASLESIARRREMETPLRDRWKLYTPGQAEYLGNLPEARPVSPYELSLQSAANQTARTSATSSAVAAHPPVPADFPDEYKKSAQYDGQRGQWYISKNGERQYIVPRTKTNAEKAAEGAK